MDNDTVYLNQFSPLPTRMPVEGYLVISWLRQGAMGRSTGVFQIERDKSLWRAEFLTDGLGKKSKKDRLFAYSTNSMELVAFCFDILNHLGVRMQGQYWEHCTWGHFAERIRGGQGMREIHEKHGAIHSPLRARKTRADKVHHKPGPVPYDMLTVPFGVRSRLHEK